MAVKLAAFAVALGCGMALAQGNPVNQRIEVVLGASAPYEQAIKALQEAVARGDAQAVAALVHFPITVRIGGKPRAFKSPDELQRQYGQVFTPAITTAVTAQWYDELFVNAQGVMFGSGQVWLNGVCLNRDCSKVEVKVVTIQAGAAR